MILKFLGSIAEKRNFAFVVLLIPMCVGFYFALTQLSLNPKSRFHYVDLTFEAPGKMARDLETLVAQKMEKTLNGVQGLVSFETTINHEQVRAHLMFNSSMDEDRIHLFLQEKLDLLKIQLGDVVRTINFEFVRTQEELIFEVNANDDSFTSQHWKKWNELTIKIRKVEPTLIEERTIRIEPKLANLIQYGISLDQLTGALRLSGLTYQLGEKKGKSYFLEGRKETISDLNQIIVGAREHRILKLHDIAEVIDVPRELPEQLKIYPRADLSRDEINDLRVDLEELFGGNNVNDLRQKNSFATLKVHFVEIVFIVSIFSFAFYLIFSHSMASVSVVVFSLFFTGQFLFWTGINGELITPLHFEAINMALVMGVFLWGIYLSRIRSYFLPNNLEVFIQRNLGQSVLFTYAEFLPTLVVLMSLFVVFCLPILLGDFSPLSKEVLNLVIKLGFPLHASLLLIMSFFTPLAWIKKIKMRSFSAFPAKLVGNISLKFLFPFLILLIASPWIKDNVKYRLSKNENQFSKAWIDYLRGYGPKIFYFATDGGANRDYRVVNETKYHPIQEWWITPNGLHQLQGRNLLSFQKSLEDFSRSSRVLSLTSGDPVLVNFPSSMETDDFGHLLVGGDEGKDPVYLKQVARPVLETREKEIIRSQMDRRIIAVSNDVAEFPAEKNSNLQMTALTVRIEAAYQVYKRNFWTVALFSFILLSLYFNSFVRGLMALVFSQTFLALPFVLAFVFNIPLPIDSLYLSTLVGWFPTVLLLFISRSIDIERLRGNEKDSSVIAVSGHIHGALSSLALVTIIVLAIWPAFSRLGSRLPQSMLDMGTYYAAFTYVAIYLLFASAFRLFYVSTERHLERVIIKVARYYYRMKTDL